MLLIDADVVLFQAAVSAQKICYRYKHNEEIVQDFGSVTKTIVKDILKQEGVVFKESQCEMYLEYGEENSLYSRVENIMAKILSKFPEHDYRLILSPADKSNYRYKLATIKPYKGHRKPKPYYYEQVRELLIQHWGAEVVTGKEADDELGTIHYTSWLGDKDTILCTIDKDLTMIPGYYYCWPNGNVTEKEMFIDELTAIKFFYLQLLEGDKTDNIPGLKEWAKKGSMGPKTAEKVLEGCKDEKECYNAIKGWYFDNVIDDPLGDHWLERIKEISGLLWIQREDGVVYNPAEVFE